MQFNKNDIDIVIHHNPCADGFGSAYVVWKYYKDNKIEKEIEYIGTGYGKKDLPNVKDKNVLILDFSYPEDIMNDMIENAKSILIIDHHKSSEKNLTDIHEKDNTVNRRFYKIFDMNHSAAMLVWNYFYPDTDAPNLIKYIEDRDIWKKEIPESEPFSTWMYIQEMTFELFEKLHIDPEFINKAVEKGQAYLELSMSNVKSVSKYAVPKFVKFSNRKNSEYAFVSHLNANLNISDLGNYIFKYQPYIDFSAVYQVREYDKITKFSLRSTKYHRDVSEVASEYIGGGGHRNASGCFINSVNNCISNYEYTGDYYNDLMDNIYYHKNIAYINITMAKKAILRYLLQVKFTTYKDKQINNATFIKSLRSMMLLSDYTADELWTNEFNKIFDSFLKEVETINTVVTWQYNGTKTIFNLLLDDNSPDNDFIYEDYLDNIIYEEQDKTGFQHLIIELDGLHTKL